MSPTFRSSESLPSLHSFQSLQRRFNESRHSSIHLLAYLSQDSVRSMKSMASHELNGVNLSEDGVESGPSVCHEVWWQVLRFPKQKFERNLIFRSDLIDSKPFKLRPLSNFGVDITPNNVSANSAEASHFRSAPARPRHRPPPLELDPRIVSSRKENVASPGARTPQKPKFSSNMNNLDPSSPWCILNQFPTPPITPLFMRESKTSASLYQLSRKSNNISSSPAPMPRNYPNKHTGDHSALQASRRKRQPSLGSIRKAYKNTSVPCPPPPVSPVWLQCDSMSQKESRTSSVLGLQRRDTFKSRLFSIGASPTANPRDLGAGDIKLPSQPSVHTISRYGNRSVSESARKSILMRQNSKPIECRARSVSQPAQSKYKRDKMGPDTPGPRDDIPPLPIDLGKHLIIPERRTRYPSYINLYVPPWKQTSSSPTRKLFPVESGVSPRPATPIGGRFELPDETMHLPAFGSAQSLTVELDPFGAGEPASFFRSNYGTPMDNIEVDQATSIFYGTIGIDIETWRRRWSIERSVPTYRVPNIVISSSQGLEELKQRNWVISD